MGGLHRRFVTDRKRTRPFASFRGTRSGLAKTQPRLRTWHEPRYVARCLVRRQVRDRLTPANETVPLTARVAKPEIARGVVVCPRGYSANQRDDIWRTARLIRYRANDDGTVIDG